MKTRVSLKYFVTDCRYIGIPSFHCSIVNPTTVFWAVVKRNRVNYPNIMSKCPSDQSSFLPGSKAKFKELSGGK